jgi:esterase/lipase superfamily enzyme
LAATGQLSALVNLNVSPQRIEDFSRVAKEAEAARRQAEIARKQAEIVREAEIARGRAEFEGKQAELLRKQAEFAQKNAEIERARIAAEIARTELRKKEFPGAITADANVNQRIREAEIARAELINREAEIGRAAAEAASARKEVEVAQIEVELTRNAFEKAATIETVATHAELTDTATTMSSEIMGKQSVLFATNRHIKPGDFKLDAVTYDRSQITTYGEAVVSIPRSHRVGMTERPGRSFVLWKETEDQGKHFVIQELSTLQDSEFLKRLGSGGDTTLVFVHGYNVAFADAIYKAAQIAFDANFDGPVMAFSWPSAGSILGYVRDNNSARFSAPQFLNTLRTLREQFPNQKIVLVAHSLGTDLVTEALHQASLSGDKLNISELVLAAPDIDKDLFASRAKQIKQIAGNVTIYASSADKALLASKTGAWASRIGFVEEKGPNLIDGMEVIDVTAVGDSMLELNHGTFSGNRSVLDDLGRIIKTGTRPPHVRSPTLRPMPDNRNVQYWMYPR